MVEVPIEKIGQASGSQSTVRQIGSALGIAVLGTVLFTATQSAAETHLKQTEFVSSIPSVGLQNDFIDGLTTAVVDSAGGALPAVGKIAMNARATADQAAEVQAAANDGFTDGVKATGWAAAGFLFLGLLSTFSMGARRRPESSEETAAKA
jgi:hypothetical protein